MLPDEPRFSARRGFAPAHRRIFRNWILLFLLTLSLSACGVRGPGALSERDGPEEADATLQNPAQESSRFVGTWRSENSVLHLFEDRTGSFDTRRCTWKQVDADTVVTECEAPIRDDSIRVFEIGQIGGRVVGQLESTDCLFRKD